MTKWTPEELRALAGAHATEIWIGTVRSALRHAADLTDAAHAVRDENDRLRAALIAIARTPTMPFPDPGAHSEQAYHQAVFRAWSQCNQTAYNALAQTGANDADR